MRLQPPRSFVRTAAVCWVATGATTLGLIFLPRWLPPMPDLAARAEAWTSPLALTRLWVGIAHPMLAMLAAAGLAAVLAARAPVRAGAAAVCLFAWGLVEMLQQALQLVALSWSLYPRYLAASVDARPGIAAAIDAVRATSDAFFFTLLLAFIAGHVLFAWAMPKASPLDRIVTAIFVMAAALGVISFLTSYTGGALSPEVMAVLYPLVQPLGRALTGVWLWRAAAPD